MKIRGYHNHRHDNQQKITFPKFITRCHFSCLRHYADSDASSDLQQESLLENQAEHHHSHEHDLCQMSSSDWGYQGNSLQNRLDRDAMEDASEDEEANQTPGTSEACARQMASNSLVLATEPRSSPRLTAPRQNSSSRTAGSGLGDSLSSGSQHAEYRRLASHNHFQMPKFHSRMWQDGFGRFRRDTIPRRDNASPVFSHRERFAGNSSGGPSWFFSPLLTGLRPIMYHTFVGMKGPEPTPTAEMLANARYLYGSREETRQDESEESTDDTDERSAFQNLADFSAVSRTAEAGESRAGLSGGQLLLRGHSSNLAEVLQSLPQQPRDSPYTEASQGNGVPVGRLSHDVTDRSREGDQSQDQSHASLFDIIDQIQQCVQDSTPTAQSEANTTRRSCDGVDAQLSRSASSRSSTWSNNALIHQLLQVLTTSSPHGTTSPRSLTSTQSSGSNANQPNWYYYDRRLVPGRNAGTTGSICQPPSYEEALAAFGGVGGGGQNLPDVATLDDPPPPYPGSEVSPPPSYDSMSSSCHGSNPEETRFDADVRTTGRFMDARVVNHSDVDALRQRIPNTLDSGFPAESDPRQNAGGDGNHRDTHHGASRDADPEPNEHGLHDQQRLGLGGRPPVRWNGGMRFERWASTHNWATEPIL